MRLLITRHGETEENILGLMQGHMPGTLSKEGIEQAEKLALRLKDEKIDAIYSSDLKRAADTTEIIAKYHPNITVFFVKELREADLGPYTGKHKSTVSKTDRPKEMESRESMQERSKSFLNEIYGKYQKGTVLFVMHNGIGCAMISVITKKTMEEIGSQKNTALNIFEIREDSNNVIHLLNCTKHLE